jgi:LPS-assembly lipoprotein
VKRLLTLAAVCGSLALEGCGFTPLYATVGLAPKLAAIEVIPPSGKTGFLLTQHLNDAFAHDRSRPAAYSMRLSVSDARFPQGLRTDGVATPYEYVVTAGYTLSNLPGGDVAKTGRVRVEVTYDSADQPYASIVAQQDAEDRATVEAARRIQLELAAWLATGEPTAKTPKALPPKDSAAPPTAPEPTTVPTPTG